MSQYFSKIYHGFLVQQTSSGWVVPQLPNWSNGPIPQGPFATYGIACHIIDRVLGKQEIKFQTPAFTEKRISGEASEINWTGVLIAVIVLLYVHLHN